MYIIILDRQIIIDKADQRNREDLLFLWYNK